MYLMPRCFFKGLQPPVEVMGGPVWRIADWDGPGLLIVASPRSVFFFSSATFLPEKNPRTYTYNIVYSHHTSD
jgi:hypothetical protein